jgi:hypothetical protein
MEGFAPRSADGLVRRREPDNRGPTPRPIRAALHSATERHSKTPENQSVRVYPQRPVALWGRAPRQTQT